MKKVVLNVNGAQELPKTTLQKINGGGKFIEECGGDGSFIYQNGRRVCCYQPSTGYYIC
ncbi:hypothetical protein P8625_04660 [Tenacibaculum tangerinum]|uniref:Bacteriocin n=1 Tax=Tenacibaculum tangerinum TaxID=3038772 RepID=A0ABY8L5U3_9FLAO|nr:hypothetical protein [Tenacibaculum tangerinum]WGH76456.1 hypothetical protein P8625_04660 [Tenacibaculum tangerinum]